MFTVIRSRIKNRESLLSMYYELWNVSITAIIFFRYNSPKFSNIIFLTFQSFNMKNPFTSQSFGERKTLVEYSTLSNQHRRRRRREEEDQEEEKEEDVASATIEYN